MIIYIHTTFFFKLSMFSTISHYAVLVKINSFSIFAHDGLAKEKKDNSANLGSFSNQKGSYSFLCHMYIGRLKT